MQRAVGEESCYRILAELLRDGERSATELVNALDIKSNSLHYHLDELVDVGLVANRKRKELGADACIRTTWRHRSGKR